MRPDGTLPVRHNAGVTFEKARQEIMASGTPSTGDDLLGMVIDFEEYLPRCPVLATVKVTQTYNQDALIVTNCVAEQGASPEAVAEQLADVWQRNLRYHYREAHQLRQTPTTVELEFVTQIDEQAFYVTGTIAVSWP
jgi:hypothetical protein